MSTVKNKITIAKPAVHGQLAYQRNIFPVNIVDIYPSNQNSADLSVIGTGENNKEYAIKRISDGNGHIPASELFCYELARKISIATPEFDIVNLPRNELAFGSVWEGGVHKLSNINQVAEILNGQINVNNLDDFLGKVYGFDLFINNIDRHFGNYLFRQSHSFMIAMAFDYSRAWLEIDYSGMEATNSKCNTQKTVAAIKQYKRINMLTSQKALDDLSKINQNTIKGILDEIPDTWLTQQKSDEIISWWGSDKFIARVDQLKGGYKNAMV